MNFPFQRPDQGSPTSPPSDASDMFDAWTGYWRKPWPQGFAWPAMPAAPLPLTGPLQAIFDAQQQIARFWLGVMGVAVDSPEAMVAAQARPAPAAPAAPPVSEAPAPQAAAREVAQPAATIIPIKPPEPKAAPRLVAVAKPVSATVAVAKPAPVAKPTGAAKSTPVAKPAAAKPVVPAIDPESMFDDAQVEKTMPPLLSAPEGVADDLTRIKGVGPKINQLLKELGVHHYRQIAAWTPGDIAWINSKLDFKGRVQREKWVTQARSMLKGG